MIIHAAQIDNRLFQGMMQGNDLLYIKASLLRDEASINIICSVYYLHNCFYSSVRTNLFYQDFGVQ